MFFGKNEQENVKPDELGPLLGSLFSKKLGRFEGRSASIVKDIGASKAAFEKACDRFEALVAEPYVDNPYFQNVSSIKAQKGPYAKALKHIIGSIELYPKEQQDIYGTYKSVLSNAARGTKEVLETNTKFKSAMFCYSSHMGDIKKSFAAIERLTEALKIEVEGRAKEAAEYNKIRENLDELDFQTEDLEDLEKELNVLKNDLSRGDRNSVQNNEDELLENLSKKRSELSDFDATISKISDKISSLTIPLEKASRRFDHLSPRKRQLAAIMEDPTNHLNSEVEYSEFRLMVQELKESIEKRTISVKNEGELLGAISSLLDSDLYQTIALLKSERSRRSEREEGLKIAERVLGDLKNHRKNLERSTHDITDIEQRIKETIDERMRIKGEIEQLVYSYYHKSISIIL